MILGKGVHFNPQSVKGYILDIFKSTLFHLKEIGSIRHRKYTCTDVSSDESLLLFFRTICVFENNKDRTLCKKCFNQEYTNALEY